MSGSVMHIDPNDPTNWDDRPEFIFRVSVDDQPRGQVFGPQSKRNWVMFKLSKYVIALAEEGTVTVTRYINGKWEPANDWRNLAH